MSVNLIAQNEISLGTNINQTKPYFMFNLEKIETLSNTTN